jgi:hypothetical protein
MAEREIRLFEFYVRVNNVLSIYQSTLIALSELPGPSSSHAILT